MNKNVMHHYFKKMLKMGSHSIPLIIFCMENDMKKDFIIHSYK